MQKPGCSWVGRIFSNSGHRRYFMKITSLRTSTISLAAALLMAATGQLHSQGTLLFQHSGATDPLTEGASLAGTGAVGPVFGDLGVDAWSISAAAAFYTTSLTTEQQTLIAANDWTMSLNLRIVTNSSFASIRTGAGGFILHLYSQSDGDPIVSTLHGLSYALEGGGPGYHNYALNYSVSSGTASLWIDGVERLSGIAASSAYTGTTFDWGITQSLFSTANWNLVSLSVVPEPSSLALCLCGGWLLTAYQLHRRVKKL